MHQANLRLKLENSRCDGSGNFYGIVSDDEGLCICLFPLCSLCRLEHPWRPNDPFFNTQQLIDRRFSERHGDHLRTFPIDTVVQEDIGQFRKDDTWPHRWNVFPRAV